jgi:hypothetical protein
MSVKVLGIVGTPACGCGPEAWVLVAGTGPQLQCFRHDVPQALAAVVDKTWITRRDLARQMVAKFLGVKLEEVALDDAMVRGTVRSVDEQLRVLETIPVGSLVTVNGRFLLYRHPDGSGSRSLGPLAASP